MEQAQPMERTAIPRMQHARREKSRALHFVEQHPALFRPGFWDWLVCNFHIWQSFERKADLVRERGRKHYSARTIVESMRYDTTLTDDDVFFKINGNNVPDLARLYNHLAGVDFFAIRGRH